MQVFFFFFFFQIKCWLSKSPYSPAPQTEADWMELLVCRVLQGRFWEHHCHVTGQPVTRSASVPWEKEFLGFIGFNDCLCVGATPSCGRMCGHFKGHLATELWGSSFLEPIKKNSWCRLRNRGTEGWSNTPVSTQLDHDQVGNQNLRFLTPCSS